MISYDYNIFSRPRAVLERNSAANLLLDKSRLDWYNSNDIGKLSSSNFARCCYVVTSKQGTADSKDPASYSHKEGSFPALCLYVLYYLVIVARSYTSIRIIQSAQAGDLDFFFQL